MSPRPNPLRALFPGNPSHASPYSPSSRLFLNVLYIDVGSVPYLEESQAAREFDGSKRFAQRLEALRNKELVDYPAVAELQQTRLRQSDDLLASRGWPRG